MDATAVGRRVPFELQEHQLRRTRRARDRYGVYQKGVRVEARPRAGRLVDEAVATEVFGRVA